MLPLLRRFIHCLAAFAGLPYLIVGLSLILINVNKPDNAKEVQLLESIAVVCYLLVALAILLATLAWQVRNYRRRKQGKEVQDTHLYYYCVSACRILLAILVMFYGFQKLINDQLQASYYWYGDELGRLSGFQLTWAFFGYSPFYNTLIALAQVGGGLLLLYRRTTLLGAVLLLPVLLNIIVINFTYNIPAKDISTMLLLMDLFLVGLSFRQLRAFFLQSSSPAYTPAIRNYTYEGGRTFALGLPLSLVALALAFLPNYMNRKVAEASPFEGAWEAVSVKNFSDSIPEKNDRLTLRMFVSGTTATIKKTYQYEDFHLSYKDSTNPSLQLVSTAPNRPPGRIEGRYRFLRADSILFQGKDGADSISWVLKKFPR
jgi:uncharacterized membrane protein YphA (DoxX/SURF4 family)